MKQRHSLLCLALVLLFAATSAMATPAESTNTDVTASSEAVVSSAVVDCDAQAGEMDLLSLTPEFAWLSVKETTQFAGDYCGACSSSLCVGEPIGHICGYSAGRYLRCQDIYGSYCGNDENNGAKCGCTWIIP